MQTKSEMINRIAELAKENAELKAYMDVNEDFKKAWEELKAENEQLKALCDTYKTCYQAKHNDIDGKLFKYRQTLQEIRTIAEEIADTGNWLNCGYNASRAKKILDLIAKSESEE